MNTYDISSLDKMDSVALELLRLSDNRIFALHGDVGVGKTTLVKYVCNHLQVVDAVSSPTFSIINEYLTQDELKLFHFDLYRLKDVNELEKLGIDIYINSGHYCFIEWPVLVEPFLPEKHHVIRITKNTNNRKLVVLK